MNATKLARRTVGVVVALLLGLTAAFAAPAGAAPPTVAPTIVAPAGGATVTSNPILLWEPLPDVTKYRVTVSTSPTFSSTLWSIDTYNTSATPTIELPLGTLYWRVAGMEGSTAGPFASAEFVRNQAPAPVPLAPASGDVLTFPTEPVILRWEPVAGAKNYRVEVDDAPDFIGAQQIVTDVPNWALLNTQPVGQTFYWRVQAQGTVTGVNTPFSPTQTYSLSWGPEGEPLVPTLNYPAPGQGITDVVFRWTAVAGAAKYQIQVSPNGDWANNVTIDEVVTGTSFSPAKTLNNSPFFWRVRALSVRNPADAGPWSADGREFTREWTDQPVLVSPADDDTRVDELLLQWNPVPYAGAYEVQIGTDPAFSSTDNYTTCTTNHTDLTPTWYETPPAVPSTVLPGACAFGRTTNHRLNYARQGVRYYWRVRGLDISAGVTPGVPTVTGRFSTVRSFQYLPDPDGIPTPISPAPGSTVGVPTLRWGQVRGAERYEVVVRRNGSVVTTAKTYGTSFTPSMSVPDGEEDPTSSSISWTVQALQHEAPNSASGNLGRGPVANGGSFTWDHTESGAGGGISLLTPAAGAGVVHPSFDWTPVSGAHHYEVHLIDGSTYTVLTDQNEGGGELRNPWRSAFTPTGVTRPGNYQWRVVAFDEDGATLAVSAERNLTIDYLDVAVPSAPAHCGEGIECTAEASTPLMQWEPVDGAAFYKVKVALDPLFTNVIRIYRTTQNSMRPMEALPDSQAGKSYYWFVVPCRSDLQCGEDDEDVWPGARAFRKQSRPISLTSPANGASVGNLVTFSWNAPSSQWVSADPNDDVEARTYRIQVSTRPDFATIYDQAEVDQRTYTPWDPDDDTYPEGPLYWRVQARDASGNYLTMSEVRLVNKVSPGLVVTSPSNGADVNGVPVIQWNSQVFAASYEVEYYRNGDLAFTPTNKVQTTLTQLNADTMVKSLPLGQYAYRIRRRDVAGLPGPWTSGRTFDVVGGSPSPTAPANGFTYSQPRVRLEWDPVPNAVQYKVETSASAGFSSLVEDKTTVMTAWSTAATYPNGTIYWRVRALDAQGNVLGTSSTRSYVLDQTRPTATITKVTAGVASVLVEWSATAGGASGPITSFRVTPYVGSTEGTSVVVGGTVRQVRVTGLVNGTAYKFRVTPSDANGVGVPSALSASVTPRNIAPFTSVDRFIDRQYRDLLNRPPSSSELTTWRTRLQGGWSADQMVVSLWNSSAHADVMPAIARLYSAYYLRIPDFGGLMYWANDRMRGNPPATLPYVSNFFANSAEFKALYGSLTNRQFVELIYQNILGRPGEPDGINFWTGQLNSGARTRGWVMVGFSNSSEYKTRFGPEIDAALVHLEMLRRAPTTSERNAMAARFRDGDTLNEIVTDVLGSSEYAARGI